MHTKTTDLEGVNGPCPSVPDFTEFLQFPEGAPELFGIVWVLIGQVQITLTFCTFTIDYRFVLNKKMFGFHNSNPLLYKKKNQIEITLTTLSLYEFHIVVFSISLILDQKKKYMY